MTFSWHTETVGGGNDQGSTAGDVTYVVIRYGASEQRLYEHGGTLAELVQTIGRLTGPE
ncbi:hypothetical protein [Saccharothrix variisporea]|uniref:Uncharacterized protein n=1 Tax=Saccharothrix variisporea TaxID=543527 RepID=A0A495X774_9PSEU|nr:hypothetical protein [Saccharothrix variisporea]RKT68513.1 hypothetical protein DFJ66_1698 [Saccharothrix variisporea]